MVKRAAVQAGGDEHEPNMKREGAPHLEMDPQLHDVVLSAKDETVPSVNKRKRRSSSNYALELGISSTRDHPLQFAYTVMLESFKVSLLLENSME